MAALPSLFLGGWELQGWELQISIVIPSERDPSLRGERESRDLAFLSAAKSGHPCFWHVGTKLHPIRKECPPSFD